MISELEFYRRVQQERARWRGRYMTDFDRGMVEGLNTACAIARACSAGMRQMSDGQKLRIMRMTLKSRRGSMKTLLLLLCLASAAYAGDIAPEMSCGIPLGANLNYFASIRTDCCYPLIYVRALQKLRKGYLIKADPSVDAESQIAYLETNATTVAGGTFGGYAYRAGTYSYIAVDGFEKTIVKFKECKQVMDK